MFHVKHCVAKLKTESVTSPDCNGNPFCKKRWKSQGLAKRLQWKAGNSF